MSVHELPVITHSHSLRTGAGRGGAIGNNKIDTFVGLVDKCFNHLILMEINTVIGVVPNLHIQRDNAYRNTLKRLEFKAKIMKTVCRQP